MGRLAAAAGLVMAIALAGITWADYALHRPLRLPASGYELVVERGNSLHAVAERLATDGVLDTPVLLAWYGRLTGQAARVHAGEYLLEPGSTAVGALDQLVAGRVRLHSLTVLEGWTVAELLRALAINSNIVQTLPDGLSAAELAVTLEFRYASAEGWFFPDTYRFARGTTDVELLMQAHALMQTKLTDAWATRAPGLPLKTPYDALILASIVERESALDRERPRVAGVFTRRLERGMRLQTDPTVIYGLGTAFDGNLTRRNLVTDSPYNTYMRKGLPPTPISLPGASSLHAAVHPDDGAALYFVATGKSDGSHYFSATLSEHNAAVARYLAELRRQRASSGDDAQ